MSSPKFVAAGMVVLVVAPAAWAAKWQGIESLPGRQAVGVMVQDKERNYFRLTPQEPIQITLEGPGALRIVSRVELGADANQVVSYHLRVSEGAKLLDEQSTEASGSSLVRLAKENRAVGKSRRMSVDIPAGKHHLVLAVDGAASVLVRLMQGAPAPDKDAMVTLTPVDAPRSVLLTEGEKTIPYYSLLPGQTVRLRVVGPTNLELLTRLDYDTTMRGAQNYRISISEGGRVVKQASFSTTKATTAVYADLPDRVPSKFDRIQLAIDSGTHELTLALLEPAQGSAEIHAQIPQVAIGDEE